MSDYERGFMKGMKAFMGETLSEYEKGFLAGAKSMAQSGIGKGIDRQTQNVIDEAYRKGYNAAMESMKDSLTDAMDQYRNPPI
jgi:flagellar biosynthesis/type III secretory pathway protein FliH